MTSTRFFAITAGLEAGAGLALIVASTLVVKFLFGPPRSKRALPSDGSPERPCYP